MTESQIHPTAIVDPRARIAATRWPDREVVPGQSQGAQRATIPASPSAPAGPGKN